MYLNFNNYAWSSKLVADACSDTVGYTSLRLKCLCGAWAVEFAQPQTLSGDIFIVKVTRTCYDMSVFTLTLDLLIKVTIQSKLQVFKIKVL